MSKSFLALFSIASAQQIVFDDTVALVRMDGTTVLSYNPSANGILSLHVPIRKMTSLAAHDASIDAQLWFDDSSAQLIIASATPSGSTLSLSRDSGLQQLTLNGRLTLGDGVTGCPAP